ncbi:hypothetical protein MMC10_001076 [Thelotrema lepadinum]|nr:hypothetical protein [Thelotrema lepadinum]
MPTVAFRRNMLISFFIDKLYDGRHTYGNSDWWILQVQDSHTSSIALDALVTKFFGQASLQKELILEGTKYYTQALSSLRQDLASPNAFSLGTLAATSILSMFELITFSSHNGWIQHAGGLARLMQARGPWRHKSSTERKVLLENRILLVGNAMMSRKRTFLEERDWKDVPWEDAPENKDPYDHLIDIACDIPGMLEDIDHLAQQPQDLDDLDNEGLFLDLVNRSERAFDELDAWWRSWATANLHSCVERPPDADSKISYDENGPVFDSVLHFESYWACYIMIFHNALRILLLSVWEQTSILPYSKQYLVRTPIDETNPLPLLGISQNKEGLALEIFRCIEFCEYQTRRFMGNSCVLFPIFYAQQALDPVSREGQWLLSLPQRRLESFKTFDSAMLTEGLPSCGTGLFGEKVMSNSEMQRNENLQLPYRGRAKDQMSSPALPDICFQ